MEKENYQKLSDKLDDIARLTLIGVKPVLDITEAAAFTGMSVAYLYRMTSSRQIPHFKKNRKLYFRKEDLEGWMLDRRVPTDAEVSSRAATYAVTHRRR